MSYSTYIEHVIDWTYTWLTPRIYNTRLNRFMSATKDIEQAISNTRWNTFMLVTKAIEHYRLTTYMLVNIDIEY